MDMYAGGQRSGNIKLGFLAPRMVVTPLLHPRGVYIQFLVVIPATSAPNKILVPPHSVIVSRLLRTSTDPNLFVGAGRYTPPSSFLFLLYFRCVP